jgi:hypothetical protein
VFTHVRLDERTDGHNLQPLGVGCIDGRLRERVGEMVAAKWWRNFCMDQHERRGGAFVRENGRLTVGDELELIRLAIVGDYGQNRPVGFPVA